MSHLAYADEKDADFNLQQIARFKEMYKRIENHGFAPTWRCIGNSAGMTKIYDDFFNGRRTGIAFYGYNHLDPFDQFYTELDALQPALRVLSKVISKQQLQEGDTVGYS